MIQYKTGEIVLLEYPFTDSLGSKKRPALVIIDCNDDDIVCARITTQIYQTKFDIKIENYKDKSLLAESVIRCHKLATLSKSLVNRKLGTLSKDEIKKVKKIISDLFDEN
ncbi:MAG: type II toxin-antitoxin system PemK/MazF family toxin [Candidatus Kapabacteria bacterium]|nr:type II toxin-antitoxin system PemK/MazF family toxin [Candidatus Kapabacteria bacterium]